MLVRVDTNYYVNTDAIMSVDILPRQGKARITLFGGIKQLIPESAGAYLIEAMEVNEGWEDEGVTLPAPLKSQIAVRLRDCAQGVTARQIKEAFVSEDTYAVADALDGLLTEKVIVQIDGLFYHSSSNAAQELIHKERDRATSNPGLSAEGEALPGAC